MTDYTIPCETGMMNHRGGKLGVTSEQVPQESPANPSQPPPDQPEPPADDPAAPSKGD